MKNFTCSLIRKLRQWTTGSMSKEGEIQKEIKKLSAIKEKKRMEILFCQQ